MMHHKKSTLRRTTLKPAGISPGTLIYTGLNTEQKTQIELIQYHENSCIETPIKNFDQLPDFSDKKTVYWMNVDGLADISIIEKIGNKYHLNALVLEDILNVSQIPKIEDYEDSGILFITMDEFYFNEDESTLYKDQMSFIIGENFVITFQESEGDVFEPVRERILQGKGKIRKRGADYLAYALMDALVDSYYYILDKYKEDLLEIENSTIENPKSNQLTNIHLLSKSLIYIRKSVAPLKEVIFKFQKDELAVIKPESKIFIRDLFDHTQQILNSIDADREFLTDLINVNMSNTNSRMNEIMKVLTLISTIFIPLTFIVGVYGMNFENFPELKIENGYFYLWAVMIFIVIIQLIIFKKKGWL